MEYKSLPILSKSIGEDRIVRSIFSVFGNVDDGGDRIWPGAFAKTILERKSRIKVLWQHDSSAPPVGMPESMEEIGRSDLPDDLKEQYPDASGALLASVRFLETPRGDEVLAGIRAGAITENSIGYDPIKYDFEDAQESKWGTIRNLRELRLWDLSPVNWGMNAATTTNVKSSDDPRVVSLLQVIDGPIALLEARYRDLKAGRRFSATTIAEMESAMEEIMNGHQRLRRMMDSAEPPAGDDSKALTAESVLARLSIAEREYAQLLL